MIYDLILISTDKCKDTEGFKRSGMILDIKVQRKITIWNVQGRRTHKKDQELGALSSAMYILDW